MSDNNGFNNGDKNSNDFLIDSDNDLDIEIVQSMKKLVEEQTNVARAYIKDENKEEQSLPHDDVSRNKALNYVNSDEKDIISEGKTQVIPPVNRAISPVYDNNDNNKNVADGDKEKHKKLSKKTWIIIISAIAAVLVIIGIIIAVVVSNNRKSYEYNKNQGIERYENGKYAEAIDFFTKAYNTSDGKRDADLMYDMYDSYMKLNNKADAKKMLDALHSYDKYNELGVKALADYYLADEDGAELTALIRECKDSKAEQFLKKYELAVPTASKDSGDYATDLDIVLSAKGDATIYYTLDNKEPSQMSDVYTEPINIKQGKTTIKAMAVSSIGLCSDIVTYDYTISYGKPASPELNPDSGSYTYGKKFEISNMGKKDKAYYTLDGSAPTTESAEYTEPVVIPSGNVVVSVMVVNEYGVESSVTRKNYNIEAASITYSKALDLLSNKLVSAGVLNSNGNATTAGNPVQFKQQSNITVDGNEMYFIAIEQTKGGSTSIVGNYGVSIGTGDCYKITGSSGKYKAEKL